MKTILNYFFITFIISISNSYATEYTRTQLESFSKETLIEIIMLIQNDNPAPKERVFSARDAKQCQKFDSYQSERLCLKNRVSTYNAKSCFLESTRSKERKCLNLFKRAPLRFAQFSLKDKETCIKLTSTEESENICIESKSPHKTTVQCVKFDSYESERLCLKANKPH